MGLYNGSRKLIFLLFALFITDGILAEELPLSGDLLEGLDPAVLSVLKKDGHVVRYDEEFSGPVYVPSDVNQQEIISLHRDFSPEVMTEALYILPYPEGQDKGDIVDRIFSLSHRVSTISGVKYFSRRKQDYAVLFDDVYAVENPRRRKRLDDPVPSGNETEASIYLHMDENALGRDYYQMRLKKSPNYFSIQLRNESTLGFIITAVDKHNMIIRLSLYPCSDCILIYGYCGLVLKNDDIVMKMLDPYYSFYRRMTAMEVWLYNSLHGTDILPPLKDPMP